MQGYGIGRLLCLQRSIRDSGRIRQSSAEIPDPRPRQPRPMTRNSLSLFCSPVHTGSAPGCSAMLKVLESHAGGGPRAGGQAPAASPAGFPQGDPAEMWVTATMVHPPSATLHGLSSIPESML